jgi:hypothetical protein
MNNLYYMVWADAIQSFRKHHPNKTNWKSTLFIFLTWMHALNAWMLVLWLKYFDVFNIPKFSVDIFPGKLLDSFTVFVIEFALPFAILNYFLIFHKNRYEKITNKYKDVKKRYAQIYSYSMIFGAFISAILYGILTKGI